MVGNDHAKMLVQIPDRRVVGFWFDSAFKASDIHLTRTYLELFGRTTVVVATQITDIRMRPYAVGVLPSELVFKITHPIGCCGVLRQR